MHDAASRYPVRTDRADDAPAVVNVGMLLEMVADAAGDRLVVGSRRDGLTAGELQTAARRIATLFRFRDVENVGMVDLNSAAVPIALFGASLAGLPFAPINYRLDR